MRSSMVQQGRETKTYDSAGKTKKNRFGSDFRGCHLGTIVVYVAYDDLRDCIRLSRACDGCSY